MIRKNLQNLIRKNTRTMPVRTLASACEKFLRCYHNEDTWDAERNGERRIISALKTHQQTARPVILDVGAFDGRWTASVLTEFPDAQAYCFELVAERQQEMRRAFANSPNVTVLDYALSDSKGSVEYTENDAHPQTTSIAPRLGHKLFSYSNTLHVRTADINTGMAAAQSLNLEKIDFLKIDTEGHEAAVLRGFAPLFNQSLAPRMIQFEYGDTYLPFHTTLADIYDLLRPHGYVIGRVYPSDVRFKDYTFADDHFRLGNYVAVKADDPLRRTLANRA